MSHMESGQAVGRYRLLREVGAGGMGTVYEAVHEEIGRRAAIKVLHPELARDPQMAVRFVNEARAANLLRHPGFVEIYEFGRLPAGEPYIVMEFLDGELLAHRLQRFPRGTAVRWTLELLGQMAAALATAHERGVIHRDLKPDNVMLVAHPEWPGRERVKILDLGIAKLHDADSAGGSSRTRTGIAMGTPQYMAPEQCAGASRVDGQADVYSLGVILYEALSGQRPFDGESALSIMNQQVLSAPIALRALRPELSVELAALVEQLLAKPAGERPTMRQLVEAAVKLAGTLSPEPAGATGELPAGGAASAGDPLSPSDQLDHTRPRLVSPRAPSPLPLPPSPSLPFVVGPPIGEPQHFIGRQRELRRLCNLWRQPPLQNAALVGPKRAGKTSVLLTLKNAVGTNPPRSGSALEFLPRAGTCQFIYVDFQDPRMSTVDGLLRHLLGGLRLQVPARCDLDRFMDAVAGRLHTPTVILMDEIGVALERYRELDVAFWEGLRALATSQTEGRLGFLLSSHRPPHELAQQSLGGSPFFNIFGYCATIGAWSEAEARSLVALSPLPFPERDTQWMLAQSQRWPILMQILCRERLMALQDGESGDLWREEALRQLLPFADLIKGSPQDSSP